ncbi:hypothetical protein AMIS_27290 [Actinoplanes missouriensis 431]|uniref:AB hydrolase-1 domain-containing protein n=1 Tax=Actinoplanes missouriensis (strain ATCC 14538 / DSM 43046 / CBS 188.64 / JCM 3121 / NBRC 102363 / NCIMB 12654 / NRRL B-3342 / UNCC 431) TaxID=512565 RepID=I0H4L2_ACTM4|nr:alpha/beta hydrolase [Actinoplanes missouriensis]BAL87949.1 hypothetical protein AMIS_27290 [Actinoplanes missouriensis 431]
MSVDNATPVADSGTTIDRQGSVDVNGRTVRYFTSSGFGEDRSPVVLVHGTGGSTYSHFPFLFPMLATAQPVISVDLATPDGPPEEGAVRLAEQVAAVIEETAGGRPVTLAGYSLGSVVAAATAASRPDLAGGLIMFSGWLKTDAQQRLRNDLWHRLRADDPDALRSFHVYCAFSAGFLAVCAPSDIEALIASAPFDDDTAKQMEINRAVDLTPIVGDIACPTLIVAGTEDQMTPYRQSKALFGAITDARFTDVTSGHAMVLERPAEMLHLATTFNADPHRFPAGTILPRRHP